MAKPIIQMSEEEIEILNFMPYHEYLQTDYWKDVKRFYFEIFEKRCFVCNKKYNIHVHHFNYESRGKESYDDVVALCGSCHLAIHCDLKDPLMPPSVLIESKDDLRRAIEIAKHARDQLNNQKYIMLLPLTKRKWWTISQLKELWGIPKTKIKNQLSEYACLNIGTLVMSNKGKLSGCYVNHFIWHLIEFEFPKVTSVPIKIS